MKTKMILSVCTLMLLAISGRCATSGPVEDEHGLPTSDRPESGSLNENRVARDYSRTVCEMIMQGPTPDLVQSLSAAPGRSINPGNRPLVTCMINCRGPQALTIHGGPALEPFASTFRGVNYIKEVQLPGGTVEIRGQDISIENSFFLNLAYMGKAAITFSDMRVTLMNSTFVANNNSAAGCIHTNESTILEILDSTFTNNYGGQAGALNLWNSSLIVNGTTFLNNTSRGEGGAVTAMNSNVIQILNSTIVHNTGTNGGGIYLNICNHTAIIGNVYSYNRALKAGGAHWQTQCSGVITTNTFKFNKGQNGGTLWLNAIKKISLDNNVVANGTADKGSGGLEINQCNADIGYCSFLSQKGDKGGAIYAQGVVGDIHDSIFEYNYAGSFGGAIFRGSTTGNIRDSTFTANRARQQGGAIYDSHVAGDIDGNLFSRNKAGSGAAIFRTESMGDINQNKNLDESADVTIDNPAPL
eukprot:jgi/Botrbrau1/10927/Bobra.0025s0100.1